MNFDILVRTIAETMLKLCRQFYYTYPNILGSATQEFNLQLSHKLFNNFSDTNRNQLPSKIRQLVTDELTCKDEHELFYYNLI